jgi:hypothetical protein
MYDEHTLGQRGYKRDFRFRVVPLLGVVSYFSLTRDRQIPSRAPDMAIRREQGGRGGIL